ncbi:putative zinc ribbon protein [Klebsiella pneumoniae]|nr:hypothetical protein [Klebsiella pneumoniae]
MRILKCYLANNASGRFVTADGAAKSPGDVWAFASCGCVLCLLMRPGENPWFEHDQQTVAESVLMRCAHLDPEVKAEIRCRRLRRMAGGLEAPVLPQDWYCVWCGSHCRGMKCCPWCRTGIFSIEKASWQTNYCCSTG